MSLDATRWAWQQRVGRSSAKLVLLSIADRASEDHMAYPSIARLSEDTELDRKTVMSCIGYLIEQGLVSAAKQQGAKTVYRLIGVEDRHQTSPKIGTGTKNGTSTKNGTAPVPKLGPVPVPNLGHEPISNQSITSKREKAREPLDFSVLPDGLSSDLWSDFLANRKALKKPLVTQTALNGVARELKACEGQGIAPDTAIRLAVEKGWLTVKPAWVRNALNDHQGNPNAHHRDTVTDRRQRAADELFRRAQSHG